jgi:nitroreductase
MKLLHAIFNRTEVKSYCAEVVDEVLIHSLLAAANQAPIGTNPQPCTFAVVQDRKTLARYSSLATQRMRENTDAPTWYLPLANHDYSMFYDASTLIVLCAYAGNPLWISSMR